MFFHQRSYDTVIPGLNTTNSPVAFVELTTTQLALDIRSNMPSCSSNWRNPYELYINGQIIESFDQRTLYMTFIISDGNYTECSLMGKTYTTIPIEIYMRNVTGNHYIYLYARSQQTNTTIYDVTKSYVRITEGSYINYLLYT